MDKRVFHTFVILVSLVVLTAGCRKEQAPEVKEQASEPARNRDQSLNYDNELEGEEGIKNAIRGYNQSIIQANMKGKYVGKISKYAVKEQVYRDASFVEERRAEDAVMRSRLSELVFVNISSSPDSAWVITSEKWHYDYVDLEGLLMQPMEEMRYELKYKIVISKRGWLVKSKEELSTPIVREINPPRALFD